MGEIWKEIPGHCNYSISNLGRVMRSRKGKGTRAGKIRKICALPCGYQYIDMWEEGEHSRLYIHQLVLLTFKGPPPTASHEGAHWDGVKSNNKLTNLRWATRPENHADMLRHGTRPLGSKHSNSKLTEKKVLKIRQLRAKGITLERLAQIFKVEMTNIDLICRRKTWKHVKDGLPAVLQTGCWRMGENCHKAKLTKRQVISIRKQFAQGATIYAITKRYPVTYGAIDAICYRRSWKHIT